MAVGDNKHICPSCGACHHPAAQRPRDRADAAVELVIGGCLIRSGRVISAASPSVRNCTVLKMDRTATLGVIAIILPITVDINGTLTSVLQREKEKEITGLGTTGLGRAKHRIFRPFTSITVGRIQ